VEPSSRWRRWLSRLGGIIRVTFKLRTWWMPNVDIKQTRATRYQTKRNGVKVGQSTLEIDDYKGINSTM
jgi:hypothetical protein